MRILLVVYDNDSCISWFPQGIAYLASACRNAGHDVSIFSQDVYHYQDSELTELLDKEHFDIAGISVIGGYYQYRKLLSLSAAVNQSKDRPFFIIGGHGPSPEPEYFLKKTGADAVCLGEGEKTIVDLLDAIGSKASLHQVDGIAFRENGSFHRTKERKLIENIDTIAFPAWDLFPMDHYSLMRAPNIRANQRCIPVLSGRGCPFKCNFCYRMDRGFRARSNENILEEIERLIKDYKISYIAFSDELLMNSEARVASLCESFVKSGLKFNWNCNGRLNYAKKEILRVMKDAGCVFINYGIESLDEKALRAMNKNLTVKQITEGIENTLESGISPGFNIIFGNIGENQHSLDLGVDFLLKYDDHAQLRTIRPVTPYPGSPLYYYAIDKGLLKDCEDFYENKHINSDLLSVNYTPMSDAEVHHALFEANRKLIENYHKAKAEETIETARKLYYDSDASFRGFRQT